MGKSENCIYYAYTDTPRVTIYIYKFGYTQIYFYRTADRGKQACSAMHAYRLEPEALWLRK